MKNRLDSVIHKLSNQTVFEQWFSPLQDQLAKVRFHPKIFNTLSMDAFFRLGALRQLRDQQTLREQVQSLFHLDDNACSAPLARSTWSDALASPKRRDITRATLSHLVDSAQSTLLDRFSDLDGLEGRQVYAIDASYQAESTHYNPVYPEKDEEKKVREQRDNTKGHMLMSVYDLRKAIPVKVETQTLSRGEMRVIKESQLLNDCLDQQNALYIVDRAFVDVRYWEAKQKERDITVISRFKSIMKFTEVKSLPIAQCTESQGVVSDTIVKLKASKKVLEKASPWRRIVFCDPTGKEYYYLTNDLTVKPGVIAFLYHRRWDEEKFFDDFKNNLTGTKAWGKSQVSIEQQALLSCMTYILTRLFLDKQLEELELEDDTTQSVKHQKKKAAYNRHGGISLRANWKRLSKIPIQVWRFLKECFAKKASTVLYELQLKHILERYL